MTNTPDTIPMRYMTKAHFRRLRGMERKGGFRFNQGISDTGYAALDRTFKFPIVSTTLHNDSEIRAKVLINEDTIIWVDMPIEFYGDLPGHFVLRKLIEPVQALGPLL